MITREPSKATSITDHEADERFPDLLRRVQESDEHFLVEKDGTPVAALISMETYARIMQERAALLARLRQFEKIAREIGEMAQQRGLTEDELLDDLKDTRHSLMREMYGDD